MEQSNPNPIAAPAVVMPEADPLHILHPDVWVLIWSQDGNVMLTEPVSQMLKTGRECYMGNFRCTDFVPLAFGTREQVQAAARSCEQTMMARHPAWLAIHPEEAHELLG